MQVEVQKLTALVDEAKKNSKKRNFVQAMELVVNFKDLDVKAPENRINETVALSTPIGREIKVCIIADGDVVVTTSFRLGGGATRTGTYNLQAGRLSTAALSEISNFMKEKPGIACNLFSRYSFMRMS